MRKTLLLFLFLSLASLGAHAEYRVFVLKIAKKSADPQGSSDYRLVESNLDPEQYVGYHTVAADEVVTYIDTWRCYGRTGDFADYCPNPKGQIPDGQNSAP